MHWWPQLRRLAAGMGLGPGDGDDVLQDVFLRLRQWPGEHHDQEQTRRWLYRVTINACLLEHRRRKRFAKVVDGASREAHTRQVAHADPPGDAIRGEELQAVRLALRELDGVLLAPLVLRYFCELDATRIGELLDLPPATVRTRLRRARLWLAQRLTRLDERDDARL